MALRELYKRKTSKKWVENHWDMHVIAHEGLIKRILIKCQLMGEPGEGSDVEEILITELGALESNICDVIFTPSTAVKGNCDVS